MLVAGGHSREIMITVTMTPVIADAPMMVNRNIIKDCRGRHYIEAFLPFLQGIPIDVVFDKWMSDQMPHKRRRKSLESKRVIIDWVKVRDFLTECKICAAAASRSGQAPIEGATAIAFQAIDALYRFTTSAPWTNTILENHAAKVAGLYKALIGFEQTYQNKLGSSSSSKSSR
eukprot:jgi/Bigna1/132232/aug1.17_g6940